MAYRRQRLLETVRRRLDGETGTLSKEASLSVAYELELSAVFEFLSLSGIEPKREVRDEAAALISACGPLTFSITEPLEPFVDVLVKSEAEALPPPSARRDSHCRC